MSEPLTADAAALASRLAARRPLVATGVFDALSAVLAQRAGFEAAFLSGSSLALTQLARPDVGLLTLTELVEATARISARVDIPLLVDADYGFGNAINVARAVQLLEQAGASGIQIEDRLEAAGPHRISDRPVVAVSTMVDKIHAALDARAAATTVISARTDALVSHGLDAALERAEHFIEAGADMVFVEGCVQPDERRRALERLAPRCPVLFNTSILAADSLPSCAELFAAGFAVVLFPGTAAAAAGAAMQATLKELQSWTEGAEFSQPSFDSSVAIDAASFLKRFT